MNQVIPRTVRSFDVVVIGAGVIGCSIAERLSYSNLSVCVVEKSSDVAEEASKANAGITSSYYAPKGTIDCDLLLESNPQWPAITERLGVPYKKIGALTVAFTEEELELLDKLYAEVDAAGVRVEKVSAADTKRMEPLLSDDCKGAVFYPDEGIIDPMRLTWKYAELAATNGVEFSFETAVTGFEVCDDRIVSAQTTSGQIKARIYINAAGVAAGDLSSMAGGEKYEMWPRKGQYWIFDRDYGQGIHHIILPIPSASTRGVEIAPTTNGSVLLGPDASEGGEVDDKATREANLEEILRSTKRMVPDLHVERAIKTYAGNRPAADEAIKVRRDSEVKNLIQATNRSTGVSTAPAIARRVFELVAANIGIPVGKNQSARRSLNSPRSIKQKGEAALTEPLVPTEEMVVCICEQVTASQILHAVSSEIPAKSIEGVRKRTNATGGWCQGSLCMAGVAFQCANAHRIPPGGVGMGKMEGTLEA